GGGLGAGLAGLVVAGRVVGDGVEAVAAVDGLVVCIERHLVAEARAAVGVGEIGRASCSERLLHVEVGGGHNAARRSVFGVRVHFDGDGGVGELAVAGVERCAVVI